MVFFVGCGLREGGTGRPNHRQGGRKKGEQPGHEKPTWRHQDCVQVKPVKTENHAVYWAEHSEVKKVSTVGMLVPKVGKKILFQIFTEGKICWDYLNLGILGMECWGSHIGEYHRVGRVLGFFSSRPNWFRGGTHLLTGEGVQIPTRGQPLWYSKYMCTLWRVP